MSLALDMGTTPIGLEAKTRFLSFGFLQLGDYTINLEDCMILIQFVLRQAFLLETKLTWRFWKYFRNLRIWKGYSETMRCKKICTHRIHSEGSSLCQLVGAVEDWSVSVESGVLQRELVPRKISVAISFGGIRIGDYNLSNADFLCLMDYVLTNENLAKSDLRRRFMKNVRRWKCFERYVR